MFQPVPRSGARADLSSLRLEGESRQGATASQTLLKRRRLRGGLMRALSFAAEVLEAAGSEQGRAPAADESHLAAFARDLADPREGHAADLSGQTRHPAR